MKRILSLILAVICLTACLGGCGHQHSWTEATCTEPRTCSECGEIEGEPLGHSWAWADCTHPKKCTLCGETEGEPLGHKGGEPTYAKGGVCEVCGETQDNALRDKMVFSSAPYTRFHAPFAQEIENEERTGPALNSPITVEKQKADYTINEVKAIPSDEEGYTDILIRTTVEMRSRFTSPSDYGTFSFFISWLAFNLFDELSGIKFPGRSMSGNDSYTVEFTIENETGSYPISYTRNQVCTDEWGNWYQLNQEGKVGVLYTIWAYMTDTVHVPSDYDGLCLYLPKEGKTQNVWDSEDEEPDAENLDVLFEPDEDGKVYGPEDYYFVRISDLL